MRALRRRLGQRLDRALSVDEASGERAEWFYADGLRDYLAGQVTDRERLPAELFMGKLARETEQVDWALAWLPAGELIQESYVNLIPTAQGGTDMLMGLGAALAGVVGGPLLALGGFGLVSGVSAALVLPLVVVWLGARVSARGSS